MYIMTLFLFFLSLLFWWRERNVLHLLGLRIQETLKKNPPSLKDVILDGSLEDDEEIFIFSDTGQFFTKDIIFNDPESCRLVMESDRMALFKTISFYMSLICLAFSIPI